MRGKASERFVFIIHKRPGTIKYFNISDEDSHRLFATILLVRHANQNFSSISSRHYMAKRASFLEVNTTVGIDLLNVPHVQ